jgi:predicted CoA-substrate-specific enzyme activase
MEAAGIDIGSRTIKFVLLKNGNIEQSVVTDSGVNPLEQSLKLLDGLSGAQFVGTGYGRHLVKEHLGIRTISEIKAHAVGARFLYGNCRTIIDIGGQDSKVISVDEEGNLGNFIMNDRCAAGTGRFLEIMARTLGFELDNFGDRALSADHSVKINSICTVFAESETISLIARRESPISIAMGIHESISNRVFSMARRINVQDDLIFTGGVAMNPCIRQLLGKAFNREILTPKNPQIVGALGAALCAYDT